MQDNPWKAVSGLLLPIAIVYLFMVVLTTQADSITAITSHWMQAFYASELVSMLRQVELRHIIQFTVCLVFGGIFSLAVWKSELLWPRPSCSQLPNE